MLFVLRIERTKEYTGLRRKERIGIYYTVRMDQVLVLYIKVSQNLHHSTVDFSKMQTEKGALGKVMTFTEPKDKVFMDLN